MSDETKALAIVPPTEQGLTVERAAKTRVLWVGAGDKALSAEQSKALAIVGEYYGLDPALGEVMLVENRVYVPAIGYVKLAHRHPQFAGIETWELDATERKALMMAADEIGFGCKVWRKDWKVPVKGHGIASERAITNPKMVKHYRELAETRAMRRTLKIAFPASRVTIPDFDQGIDVGQINLQTGEFREAIEPPREGAFAPDWPSFWQQAKDLGLDRDQVHDALRVDSVTQWPYSLAEALDVCHSYVLVHRLAPRPAPIAHDPSPSAPVEDPGDDFDAEFPVQPHPSQGEAFTLAGKLTNWGELYQACWDTWKMPAREVNKELGYKAKPETPQWGPDDFLRAYQQVAATRPPA